MNDALNVKFHEEYIDCIKTFGGAYADVISMDGSGDLILIDPAGQVNFCYHDSGESKLLADSFAESIEDNFYEW